MTVAAHRRAVDRPTPDDDLLRPLLSGGRSDRVTHVRYRPGRAGRTAAWPSWVPEVLVGRLQLTGVTAPWEHQVAAAELAWSGTSVVLSTGTASGKSLAYWLPVLSSVLAASDAVAAGQVRRSTRAGRATALYLSPTKALAGDQLRSVRALNLTGVRAATYDGDTPREEREWVRAHADVVLTNPDMLHHSVLPQHARWGQWLRSLRYVVVDECHGYRGVFGSHVAQVLRRLRRICAHYGADPVFVLASATVSDPAGSATALVGRPVVAVEDDCSPRGPLQFVLWEPPLVSHGDGHGAGENGAPVRRSATAEAADLLADLVVAGRRSLAFTRSRRAAETVALSAKRALSEVDPSLTGRVAAYRAGYLPEERRALERDLDSGVLLGVATTTALELGVDITGLDAVVLTGYPGTRASVWQQAGRAGRAGQEALAVLVARDDPLDTYLAHHPEALLDAPVEATVLDPANPYVLAPHLLCAAAELPLTEADLALFADPASLDPPSLDPASLDPASLDPVRRLLADHVRTGQLRHRPAGWFWTHRERPEVDLRGAGGRPVDLVEDATGRLLGTVDAGAAHTSAHPGAVYLHQGESYVVDALDLDGGVALLHAETPEHYTSAREITDIEVTEVGRTRVLSPDVSVHLGQVCVTSQVVGYLVRRHGSGEVLGEVPLGLPPRSLTTAAVWYTLSDELLTRLGLDRADVAGAAHAAEHAAIGLLPLVATCDRWDVGGVSTARHPDTGRATVFVHDGHPGGAGFARRGHDALEVWLTATRDAVAACGCPSGCPSCVQSPKCGNGNQPLDKAGAITLLTAVLDALAAATQLARVSPQ